MIIVSSRQAMGKISEYRKFLLSIVQELTEEDLGKMKFLCRDLLTVKEIDSICNVMDLFTLLEQRQELSKENFFIVQEILTQLNRQDLLERLLEFRRNYKQTAKRGLFACDNLKDCVTDVGQQATMVNNANDSGHPARRFHKGAEIMLRDVNAEIYEKLAFLLNPSSFKSWIQVAGKLGYTQIQVANFKLLPMQSTQLLLEDWAHRPDATVYKLHQIFTELGRGDAARELEPILAPGTPV